VKDPNVPVAVLVHNDVDQNLKLIAQLDTQLEALDMRRTELVNQVDAELLRRSREEPAAVLVRRVA